VCVEVRVPLDGSILNRRQFKDEIEGAKKHQCDEEKDIEFLLTSITRRLTTILPDDVRWLRSTLNCDRVLARKPVLKVLRTNFG